MLRRRSSWVTLFAVLAIVVGDGSADAQTFEGEFTGNTRLSVPIEGYPCGTTIDSIITWRVHLAAAESPPSAIDTDMFISGKAANACSADFPEQHYLDALVALTYDGNRFTGTRQGYDPYGVSEIYTLTGTAAPNRLTGTISIDHIRLGYTIDIPFEMSTVPPCSVPDLSPIPDSALPWEDGNPAALAQYMAPPYVDLTMYLAALSLEGSNSKIRRTSG
jgi:hypothetical protein